MTIIESPKLPSQLPVSSPLQLEKGTSIEEVRITGAKWAGQFAGRTTLDTVHLSQPDLTSAKLRESGWSDVVIEGGELGGLDLTGSSWRRVAVGHSRLSGLILAEAQLGSVTVFDSKLDLANFRFAKLSKVHFVRCGFTDADFGAATFTNVTFSDCQLSGCDFIGFRAKNVDLTTSTLERVNGISGLRGVTLTYEQMISLVPELAANMGVKILGR